MKILEWIRNIFNVRRVCSVDYRCSVCLQVIPAGEYHNSVAEFMLLLSDRFEMPENENKNNGVMVS